MRVLYMLVDEYFITQYKATCEYKIFNATVRCCFHKFTISSMHYSLLIYYFQIVMQNVTPV